MILSQEHELVLKECAVVLGVAFEKLKEAFQALAGEANEQRNSLIEIIEQHKTLLFLDDKPIWNTPQKIVMKSQVHNRKPRLARARSTC